MKLKKIIGISLIASLGVLASCSNNTDTKTNELTTTTKVNTTTNVVTTTSKVNTTTTYETPSIPYEDLVIPGFKIQLENLDTNEIMLDMYQTVVPEEEACDIDLRDLDLGGWRITRIGFRCFVDSYFKNIYLPETLERIDSQAFYNCNINGTLYLSDNLVTLENTFVGCNYIDNIYVSPDSKNFKMSNGMLYSKNKKILYYALPNNLGDIEVSNECESILSNAFINNKCQSITLGDNISKIDSNAFVNLTNLRYINISSSNTKFKVLDNVLYDAKFENLLLAANDPNISEFKLDSRTRAIFPNAFYNNKYIKKLTLNKNNIRVYDSAFKNSALEEIDLSSSNLVSIGENAFENSNIKNIDLNGVKEIGYEAFKNCLNLESILMPSSLVFTNNYLFNQCVNLNTLIIDSKYYAEKENDLDFIKNYVKVIYVLDTITPSGIVNSNFTLQDESDREGYNKYIRNE